MIEIHWQFSCFSRAISECITGIDSPALKFIRMNDREKLKTHKTFFFVQVKSVFLKIARCDRVHAIQQPLGSVCQDNMNVNV